MLILVLVVALGLAISLFATQNTTTVPLTFWKYTLSAVPIYVVALVPLLLGLFIAWILNFIKDLSQSLTISEQKDEIKEEKQEIAELTKKVHKLEIEDTKLKAEKGEDIDEDSI